MTKFKGSAVGAVIHVATHWNVHVESDRATLRQTGTVPRHKVSAVKSVTNEFFRSYAIGLRGSLSGVPEGGAM